MIGRFAESNPVYGIVLVGAYHTDLGDYNEVSSLFSRCEYFLKNPSHPPPLIENPFTTRSFIRLRVAAQNKDFFAELGAINDYSGKINDFWDIK